MKNYFLAFLLLIVGTSLFAGDLSLSDKGGNPVPDNMTIHLWGDVNTSLLKFEFDARNIGSNTHVSRMKKQEIFQVPNTINIFCWDVCYLEDSVIISTGTVTLVPNQTWLYGSTDYYPQGQLGTTTVRYSIFRTGSPFDSSYFEVQYHITGVGMEDWSERGIQLLSFPNPSTGSFNVLLPAEISPDNISIEISNIIGKTTIMMESSVNNPFLPFEIPESGIYIIRVFSKGRLAGTARQVIIN